MLIIEPLGFGYEVAGLPAPLAGIPFPTTAFASSLHPRFAWIACLSSANPEQRYQAGGLNWLCKTAINPTLSGDHAALLQSKEIAAAINTQISGGKGVAIHCDMGIERTGTVLGTVLALRGYSAKLVAREIAAIINEQQPGWTGRDFPDALTKAISFCTSHS